MFKSTFIPRISEINAAKHIRQDVVAVWMVEGSLEIQKFFTPVLQEELSLIVANINIDFINEMVFGKEVEVATSVKRIGNSSFVLQQNICQDGKLCARGLLTYINFNYSAHKSEIIPPAIVHKLEEHLIEE